MSPVIRGSIVHVDRKPTAYISDAKGINSTMKKSQEEHLHLNKCTNKPEILEQRTAYY